MLEARALTKVYQGTAALENLNLSIPGGEIFCLLGPNGSGKTTTVNLFLNFCEPTAGEALVCGISSAAHPLEVRRHVAYIPETVMLYPNLTALENLEYFAAISTGSKHTLSELKTLLAESGLQEESFTRRVKGFSKGMRQKVGIAIALAKNAQALLLDEPTSGLDPKAANEFAAIMGGLKDRGMAILMVTHDLFLAKQCGVRVGIMERGHLMVIHHTESLDLIELEQIYLNISSGVGS
ncbi:MAG: ABC transporter ATP-binding protein [Desulfurivibrionaceae bacterium]